MQWKIVAQVLFAVWGFLSRRAAKKERQKDEYKLFLKELEKAIPESVSITLEYQEMKEKLLKEKF